MVVHLVLAAQVSMRERCGEQVRFGAVLFSFSNAVTSAGQLVDRDRFIIVRRGFPNQFGVGRVTRFGNPDLRRVCKHLSRSEGSRLITHCQRIVLRGRSRVVKLFPNVGRVLKGLGRRNLHLNIISAGHASILGENVSVLNVASCFSAVVKSNSFSRPGPSPRSLFLTVRHLRTGERADTVIKSGRRSVITNGGTKVADVFIN